MEKLLIVEDNYINILLLEKTFSDDYLLETCENGDDALNVILTRYDEFCCVLLDLMLPGADGITILKKAYEAGITNELPIVVVSSYDTDVTVLDVYNYGAADILHKPAQPTMMRKRVSNLVELYTSRKNISLELLKTNMELKLSKDKIAQNNEFLINALGSVVEFRSNESGNHIRRVSLITKILMECVINKFPKYKLTQEDVEMIAQASALHDVGKIAIADAILNKPGKLNPVEFNEMKNHTIYGCEILENFKQEDNKFYRYCYEICRWHHEKYDGKGYPDGLIGDEDPIYCQATAVADCFDALVSKRIYKPAISAKAAFQMILIGECGKFGPDIMECFKKCKRKLIDIGSSELYK